jgi:hypothetical protein
MYKLTCKADDVNEFVIEENNKGLQPFHEIIFVVVTAVTSLYASVPSRTLLGNNLH